MSQEAGENYKEESDCRRKQQRWTGGRGDKEIIQSIGVGTRQSPGDGV